MALKIGKFAGLAVFLVMFWVVFWVVSAVCSKAIIPSMVKNV